MKLVKINKLSKTNFINLIHLAKLNKLSANTIVRVVQEEEGSYYDRRNIVEIWRREGGTDILLKPQNDLLDRIEFVVPGSIAKFNNDPIGASSEYNLSDLDGEALVTDEIIPEKDFVKIICRLSGYLGCSIIEESLKKERYDHEVNIDI